MTQLVEVFSLIKGFVMIGGGLWMIFGVIILAMALRNKTGPEIQTGIWQIIGGGMVIASVFLFDKITEGVSLPGTSASDAIQFAQLLISTHIHI